MIIFDTLTINVTYLYLLELNVGTENIKLQPISRYLTMVSKKDLSVIALLEKLLIKDSQPSQYYQ